MPKASETPWLRESKLLLENISRSFPSPNGPIRALENINLNVKEGEFLCIVGPSGCGKSTLLNIMAGGGRASHYLRLVHLSKFEQSYIHELSGGMKQRVAIARALAMEPDVLLMDEPFAALDAQTRDRLHEELERVWEETNSTIVFVTHNVREAVRLGDRVLLLTFRPGRIKKAYFIELPRPRQMEDPELAIVSRKLLAQLREEIDRAVREEFHDEENG